MTGTKEQADKYSADETAYDYIHRVLNKIVEMADDCGQTRESDDGLDIMSTRIGKGIRLLAVVKDADTKEERLKNTKLFIHDMNERAFRDSISIDDLNILKSDVYQQNYEAITRSEFESTSRNLIVGSMAENIKAQYYAKLDHTKEERYEPIRQNNIIHTLTASVGFYIGDPAFVLKQDILDRGVCKNNKIQTGLFNVDGVKMFIAPSTNGMHNGHDVYSGTIGIIPIELTDSKKMSFLPADERDIRMSKQINVMQKNQSMFFAAKGAPDFEQINVIETDDALIQNNMQFSM